jgi:hypothetical protein
VDLKEESSSTLNVEQEPTTDRYKIQEIQKERFLINFDLPNIRVFVEKGLSVPASEKKRYPPRSIFLDGVFAGPPFMDNENRQYSLDHHEGCVRAFTLSTCEQAAALLLKELPLSEGVWNLYANEPDMDTVLAVWLLINHAEMAKNGFALLQSVMPLVRVEGAIDSYGTDAGFLAGLPSAQFNFVKRRLDRLMSQETYFKSQALWEEIDYLDYTREMLENLDQDLFPSGYLANRLRVDIIQTAMIREGKTLVLCRSGHGIYAVENRLKEQFGKYLAVIIMAVSPNRYTLKLTDNFLSVNLYPLYDALNRKDPQVKWRKRGGNGWGGSESIGGSPRHTGTGLSPDEILRIAKKVCSHPGWMSRFWTFLKKDL